MNKAIFLDRDGVINHDYGYVYRPADFHFISGTFEACKKLKRMGFMLVIVTNQSGIARGHYTEEDFQAVTDWMKYQFFQRGIEINGVYHCPYLPSAKLNKYSKESENRKPRPGMILKAIEDLNISPSASKLVGDKPSDIEAAISAGLGEAILIASKKQLSEDLIHIPTYNSLFEFANNHPNL